MQSVIVDKKLHPAWNIFLLEFSVVQAGTLLVKIVGLQHIIVLFGLFEIKIVFYGGAFPRDLLPARCLAHIAAHPLEDLLQARADLLHGAKQLLGVESIDPCTVQGHGAGRRREGDKGIVGGRADGC